MLLQRSGVPKTVLRTSLHVAEKDAAAAAAATPDEPEHPKILHVDPEMRFAFQQAHAAPEAPSFVHDNRRAAIENEKGHEDLLEALQDFTANATIQENQQSQKRTTQGGGHTTQQSKSRSYCKADRAWRDISSRRRCPIRYRLCCNSGVT